jgi:hypothetical protein
MEFGFPVGTLRLRLIVRGARSLKDKRRVVKSVKDRLASRFNAAVAEVDDLDVYQSAVLGVAIVSNDRSHIQNALDNIVHFAANAPGAELVAADREIL